MIRHFFLIYFLFFLHGQIASMSQHDTAVNTNLALLNKDILQHILRPLVIPETLKLTDFKKAKQHFNSISLSCKLLKILLESIEVKILIETNKFESKLLKVYLKDLHDKAVSINQLNGYLILGNMKFASGTVELVAGIPNCSHKYPKLSLFLFNYREARDKYDKIYISTEKILQIINYLCDVNKRDTEDCMPLYHAIKNPECPIDIVHCLIDEGAPLENLDGKGSNALEIAHSINKFDGGLIYIPYSKNKQEKINLLEKYSYLPKKEKPRASYCSIQ